MMVKRTLQFPSRVRITIKFSSFLRCVTGRSEKENIIVPRRKIAESFSFRFPFPVRACVSLSNIGKCQLSLLAAQHGRSIGSIPAVRWECRVLAMQTLFFFAVEGELFAPEDDPAEIKGSRWSCF
ncbi:hypothetical protein GWI33_011699 [Rhynchophorus ferrugineus]|uniref:Uncharacterized protein n=1 Tax=Rhynchophorus ferrugineus TaxID=354439 RepID=A0A834IJX3_RHYFE|nr:hypothetical protein GWI33_011699 [Rhynchophorus ferrugineus]